MEAIPQADRHRLLGWLTRGDILDLWRLAGQRYSASPAQLQTAIHPSYYAPDQFPSQPDQVLVPAWMLARHNVQAPEEPGLFSLLSSRCHGNTGKPSVAHQLLFCMGSVWFSNQENV